MGVLKSFLQVRVEGLWRAKGFPSTKNTISGEVKHHISIYTYRNEEGLSMGYAELQGQASMLENEVNGCVILESPSLSVVRDLGIRDKGSGFRVWD